MTPTPHPSPGQTAPATRPRRACKRSTLVLSVLGVGLLCPLAISLFQDIVICDMGRRHSDEAETAARLSDGFLRIDSFRYSSPEEMKSVNGFMIPLVFGVMRCQNTPETIHVGWTSPPETGWRCAVNLWLVALALLVVPGLRLRTARRRAKRRSKGLCEDCGYDLRGGTGDICPECGQIVEAADEGHAMAQGR